MRLPIFQIPEPITSKVIVYIPGLWQVFLVEPGSVIPTTLETEEDLPKSGPRPNPPSKFMAVQLTVNQMCNLACRYCYADARPAGSKTGPFNIVGQGPKEMPWNIAKAALDKVVGDVEECKQEKLEVMMAGGEPTLSMPLVKSVTSYARMVCANHGLKANIGIVSNGLFNARTREWLIENMDYITISIDGGHETHNAQRPTVNGKDAYPTILKNALAIHKSARAVFGLRMTLTSLTCQTLASQILYFHKLFPGRRIGFEPVQDCGRCSMDSSESRKFFRSPTDQELVEGYVTAFKVAKENKINIKSSLTTFKSPNSNMSFCGVDGQNFAVDPEGNISGCTRVTSQYDPMSKYFYFGKYDPASGRFKIDEQKYRALLKMHVSHYPQCSNCFAKFNCKGDCAHIKAAISGELVCSKSPRCDMIRALTLGLFQLQLGLRE